MVLGVVRCEVVISSGVRVLARRRVILYVHVFVW